MHVQAQDKTMQSVSPFFHGLGMSFRRPTSVSPPLPCKMSPFNMACVDPTSRQGPSSFSVAYFSQAPTPFISCTPIQTLTMQWQRHASQERTSQLQATFFSSLFLHPYFSPPPSKLTGTPQSPRLSRFPHGVAQQVPFLHNPLLISPPSLESIHLILHSSEILLPLLPSFPHSSAFRNRLPSCSEP